MAWPLHGSEMYDEADEAGYAAGLEDLLAVADGSRIRAIVAPGISARHAPAVLAANAHRLPRLRSLFLGCTDPDHFVSAPMGERLRAALPGVEIDLSEPHDRRAGPYISVAE